MVAIPKEKDKPKAAKVGRPSTYKKEVCDIVLKRLANGESLNSICKDDDMPERMQVMDWTIQHEEFRLKYKAARELQAEIFIDDMLAIADDSTDDEVYTDTGKRVANVEFIQRSRVRIDTRKWIASKILPKIYGDKVTQEVSGIDGGPIESVMNINFIPPKK